MKSNPSVLLFLVEFCKTKKLDSQLKLSQLNSALLITPGQLKAHLPAGLLVFPIWNDYTPLILIAAIGLAVWSGDQGELTFISPAGAFDRNDNPLVWIFTVNGCGKPREDARNGLQRRRVAFEEEQVDFDSDIGESLQLWRHCAVITASRLSPPEMNRWAVAADPRRQEF